MFQITNDKAKSNHFGDWASIKNTTRPRPEGGEDEESKPVVDGPNSVNDNKVI